MGREGPAARSGRRVFHLCFEELEKQCSVGGVRDMVMIRAQVAGTLKLTSWRVPTTYLLAEGSKSRCVGIVVSTANKSSTDQQRQ